MKLLQFIDHDIIKIDSNDDFEQLALDENWEGNGTNFSPFIIDGYKITSPTINLIDTSNTDLFINITNCYLFEWKTGILLTNVTNGFIENNIVTSISAQGIYLKS